MFDCYQMAIYLDDYVEKNAEKFADEDYILNFLYGLDLEQIWKMYEKEWKNKDKEVWE